MKKLAILAVLLLVLASCAQEDLPPVPPPPGGGSGVGKALAGLAAGMPAWAAEAKNIAVTPDKPYFNDGVIVSVSNFDYIYKNGYLFNSKQRTWEKFELQGEAVQEWLKGTATGDITIDANKFETGDNYAVIYACSKSGKEWDCNGKKWMLVTFKVMGSATGMIPEFANIDQFVVKSITPFELMNTLAEKDNFNEINVIRYDGKYKASNGLIVLVHVFNFNDRTDLDKTLTRDDLPLKDIIQKGTQKHLGHNVAVYLTQEDHRTAFWSSGKSIIWVEAFEKESANKEVIETYLQKYPSDLVKS